MSTKDGRETGTATVDTSLSRRRKVLHEEAADAVVPTPEPPTSGQRAVVRFGQGVTLNMGNFESWRCDVVVELPCKPTFAAIDVTYEAAKDWVEARIQTEVDAVSKKRG